MKSIIRYLFIIVMLLFISFIDIFSQTVDSIIDSSVSTSIIPNKIRSFCSLDKNDKRNCKIDIDSENFNKDHMFYGDCGIQINKLIRFPNFGVNNVSSEDVMVNSSEISGSEISVFVDPNHKDVIKEFNMYKTELTISNNYSSLKGINGSWTHNDFFSDAGYLGDPTTVINRNGVWFVSYLQKVSPCSKCSVKLGVYSNVTNTWEKNIIATPIFDPNHIEGYWPDKPHLSIDNSVFDGNLYSAWTRVPCNTDQMPLNPYEIEISRSIDNGVNWDKVPQLISTNVYAPDAESAHSGVNIQTGPNGEVYVVWAVTKRTGPLYLGHYYNETGLAFIRSLDKGITYENTYGRLIISIQGLTDYPNEAPIPLWWANGQPMNSHPSMCVDKSGGPHNGRIYIVWANHGYLNEPPVPNGYDKIIVYLIYSDDQGISWSHEQSTPIPPIIVSVDFPPPFNACNQHSIFPRISCDDETGVLSVIYYDDVDYIQDEYNLAIDVHVAMSRDYGSTWDHCRVSDDRFLVPANYFFGDYIDIFSTHGLVYPVFTDARTNISTTTGDDCLPQVYISPYYAWNCVDHYHDMDNTTVIENVQADKIREWEVIHDIEARNTIYDNGTAVYNAGLEIRFLPTDDPDDPDKQFWAKEGSYVHAYIEGCSVFPGNTDQDQSKNTQQKSVPSLKEQKISETNVKIFPNPCNGKFQIEFNDLKVLNGNLEITNSFGIEVYSVKYLGQAVLNIDISNCPKGLYLIKLFSKDKTYCNKIIND